jgi:hypothetical protein
MPALPSTFDFMILTMPYLTWSKNFEAPHYVGFSIQFHTHTKLREKFYFSILIFKLLVSRRKEKGVLN